MTRVSEAAILERYDRPWRFYLLSTVGTWAAWFLAGWISHRSGSDGAQLLVTALLLLGLFVPLWVAWELTRGDPVLRADLRSRLTRFDRQDRRWTAIAVTLMFLSIVVAQAISLLFGYSVDQFRLNLQSSFAAGMLSGWFALIIAPIIEEMSWHSYGTDTLRRRMNLLATSILFAVFWFLWHVPLGLIEGYYHSNVVETGPLYTINLIVSVFPFVILMNYFYMKSNRSVIVAIAFHMFAGIFNEMFHTHPMSKVIQNGLLIVLCLVLIWREPAFFLSRRVADAPPR